MDNDVGIWQVLPHLPGSHDGVGDYALTLAQKLLAAHGLTTTFVVAAETSVREKEGFPVIAGLDAASASSSRPLPAHVILHYANYGYQRRGVPFQLLRFARDIRPRLSGRWITAFHELYASGAPWRSAFWVRPLQVRIARGLMDLSDSCVVSNDVIRREIARHDPAKPVHVLPVMSNFGEPPLSVLAGKSPKRWAIAGGTALIERSMRSFAPIQSRIPPACSPDEIEIVGGLDTPSVRRQLRLLCDSFPAIAFHYHPQVSVEKSSAILASCTFGWLDYFGRGKAWPGMIFKSSSFAAFCAHGIVPILSHEESGLSAGGDFFPDLFYMTGTKSIFPEPETLDELSGKIRAWYDRNASSTRAAEVYAEALK
jgi:hypothetical protein